MFTYKVPVPPGDIGQIRPYEAEAIVLSIITQIFGHLHIIGHIKTKSNTPTCHQRIT